MRIPNEIIDNLRKWHNKLYDDDPIERKTVVIVIPKHPNHMGNVASAFEDILQRLSHPVPTLIIDDESDQQTRNVANRNHEPERRIVPEQSTIEEIADALDLNPNYLADLNNMHVEDLIDKNQEIITRSSKSKLCFYKTFAQCFSQFIFNVHRNISSRIAYESI